MSRLNTENARNTCGDLLTVLLSFHQNYLSSRGKSWRDLLQEAVQGLQQGNYYLTSEPLNRKPRNFNLYPRASQQCYVACNVMFYTVI